MSKEALVFVVHEDCLKCRTGNCRVGLIGKSPFFHCGGEQIWWPTKNGPHKLFARGLIIQDEPPLVGKINLNENS